MQSILITAKWSFKWNDSKVIQVLYNLNPDSLTLYNQLPEANGENIVQLSNWTPRFESELQAGNEIIVLSDETLR